MRQIWAPWRIEYIKSAQRGKPEGCILCDKPKQNNDALNYILYRGDKNFVIMNSYPYNPGHVMLIPRRHLEDVRDLRRAEQRELHDLQACTLDVLEQAYAPHGFNVGFNLGKTAGASLPHLHLHVVPRYHGELGFMDLLSQTRTLVEPPRTTVRRLRARLRRAWNA